MYRLKSDQIVNICKFLFQRSVTKYTKKKSNGISRRLIRITNHCRHNRYFEKRAIDSWHLIFQTSKISIGPNINLTNFKFLWRQHVNEARMKRG